MWFDVYNYIYFYTNRLVDVNARFDRFKRFQTILALFVFVCLFSRLLADTQIPEAL